MSAFLELIAPAVAIILLALAVAGVWYVCQGIGWVLAWVDLTWGTDAVLPAFVLVLAGFAVLVRAVR